MSSDVSLLATNCDVALGQDETAFLTGQGYANGEYIGITMQLDLASHKVKWVRYIRGPEHTRAGAKRVRIDWSGNAVVAGTIGVSGGNGRYSSLHTVRYAKQ